MTNPLTPRTWAKLALLLALIGALIVLDRSGALPHADELRDRVEGAGAVGVVVFVMGYAALSLLPAPKALLTVAGAVLYGLWAGAFLAWLGAMIGAVLAFGIGRLLGREAVDRLTRGRVARADRLLSEHGLGAVVAVRLVPVIPFTAINYTAGLTGVRFRDYALGTALGMVPGSLAYAALGAWGADPWGIFAGLAALVVLVFVGGLAGRRLLPREEV